MYATFSDFVKDCTQVHEPFLFLKYTLWLTNTHQIFHNAKFYNRPVSEIYKHAEILEVATRSDYGRS